MKGQAKFKKLLREVKNLILNFVRPYGLEDEMLAIPDNIRKLGFKIGLIGLGMTVLTLSFAFMLRLSNMMIEAQFILLGIILFMLQRGQRILREAYTIFESTEYEKFDQMFKNQIALRGGKIIGTTYNKIFTYDKENNLYKVMPNEDVVNNIKNYLFNFWQTKIYYFFDCLKIFSVMIMLLVAIITNNTISQWTFIPIICVFAIVSFFTSAHISLTSEDYYKERKKHSVAQEIIFNDLLRIPSIVKKDLTMRIEKLQKTIEKSNANVQEFNKQKNISRLYTTLVETLSQYGVIILFIVGIEWNSISLATITQIVACLLIVETAIGHVGSLISTLSKHTERLKIIEKEEKNMRLILDVYYQECAKSSTAKIISNISIEPFQIKYLEESENDKPFTLTSQSPISINQGEIAILNGVSGSGKSTFMKLITDRIRIKKSTEISTTSRFLFYDEKLKMGSLSIWDELFCNQEDPDLAKMQSIMESLHLWQEISAISHNVEQWLKEKRFGQVLSNGQNQRLILAKLLYWLDEDIDVVVLDECTSGLDDKSELDSADAERILEYIVRYINQDKKRIVVISTHQNIDGFKEKLSNEFKFKNFRFVKEGEYNLIKED